MHCERTLAMLQYLQLDQTEFKKYAGDSSSLEQFRTFKHKFLVLCSSRSGSELLCYLLRDFGARTSESMNRFQHIDYALEEYRAETLRQVLAALCEAAPPTVFSAKGTGQIVLPLMFYDELPRFRSEWKFIVLQRRDVVRQAISLAIAERTGRWHEDAEPIGEVHVDDFDPAHILRCMDAIAQVNAHIARLVSALGVETLQVTYEDLVADKRGISDRIGGFLDLSARNPPTTCGAEQSTKSQLLMDLVFSR